ncbi:MAG: hypothetical protein AB2665_06865 [Candidatus Thiodiazotropha sp.]
MNALQLNNLSGALYYPTSGVSFPSAILEHPYLISDITNIYADWHSFRVTPPLPWIEPNEAGVIKPNYQYLFRNGSHGRFLLVAEKKILVDKLFSHINLRKLINNTPFVDVPGLVGDLMKTPRMTPYSLGAIWARVEGQGQAFRTIVLYGNDLASSSLFRNDVEPKISPYRITLRKNKLTETLTIGTRGELNFPLADITGLDEVDAALRVIGKQLDRLDWTFEEQ